MITDFKQPARNWLADNLRNFGTLLENDEDPSCTFELHGAEVEIRLNKLPGVFERETIEAEGS